MPRQPGEGTFWREGEYYCWKRRVGSSRTQQKTYTVKDTDHKSFLSRVKTAQQLIEQGKDPRPVKAETWEHLLTTWLESFVKPPVRSQKTYDSYKERAQHLIKAFGKVRIDQLEAWHVQSLINKMLRAGFSPRTIEYTVDVLFRCGRRMKKRAAMIELKDCISFPERAPQRKRVLKDEEWDKVVAALTKFSKNPQMKRDGPWVRFLLFSGCRVSESSAVLEFDVRRKDRKVVIGKQLEWYRDNPEDKEDPWKWRFKKPKGNKNYSTRTLKLGDEAWAAVEEQLAMNAADRAKAGDGYEEDGFLFATETGRPRSRRNLKRTLDAIIADTGIPHFTIHDLRRTCLTRLAKNKTAPHVLGAVAGHAPGSRVLGQYYTWADQEDMDAATVDIRIGKRAGVTHGVLAGSEGTKAEA